MTPLYPQKLALTLPTGSGRSVGMVRLRTKATEISLVLAITPKEFSILIQIITPTPGKRTGKN